ncbi:BPSL0067 family protein [Sorangium sp. So ce136]|uniref:BPSL0067 family protein n=1 Tax=Sorangium sp. So ce136 TaxID=3133284 RepID=UPI003F09B422
MRLRLQDHAERHERRLQLAAAQPPTPITITSANLEVFNNGNYDAKNRLLWDDVGTQYGGNRFTSTYSISIEVRGVACTRVKASGDATGQCVSLIKSLSSRTGATSGWTKGDRAVDNCAAVPLGTAVATFSGTTYSGHTGFLCGCSATSIVLCDQNYSSARDGLVRRHAINRTDAGGVGDAAAYYVVLSSS